MTALEVAPHRYAQFSHADKHCSTNTEPPNGYGSISLTFHIVRVVSFACPHPERRAATSLSAITSMFKEPKGCGQSGLILTLYLVRESGDIHAIGTGFRLLPCGHFPRPHDMYSVGILLCESCAAACNFPKLKRLDCTHLSA